MCSIDYTGRAKLCARCRASYQTASVWSAKRDVATLYKSVSRLPETNCRVSCFSVYTLKLAVKCKIPNSTFVVILKDADRDEARSVI